LDRTIHNYSTIDNNNSNKLITWSWFKVSSTSSGNARINEQDLGAIADILEKIKEFFNSYFDSRGIFIHTIGGGIENLREAISRGLRNTNAILDYIIRQCREDRVDEDTRQRIQTYNLKADHLKFEQAVLEHIFGKFWEGWRDRLDIRKWLRKALKAINVIIDSLKLAFPQLDAVKQFKDHFLNLSED
jgi:uncharacterized protein YlaI